MSPASSSKNRREPAIRRSVLTGLAALALVGCAWERPAQPAGLCGTAAFAIAVNFEGAGAHSCEIDAQGVAIVRIRPEAEPINPSPWYAFAIDSVADRPVRVRLLYETATHRYAPKARFATENWRALSASEVEVSKDGRTADIVVSAKPGRTLVAAQPVESVADSLSATRAIAVAAGFQEEIYGRSVDGRPLVAFLGGPPDATELVVALTRQHPPERSGALAFRAFAEQIAAARGDKRVLLAPLANPDGLVRGHWRGNANGLDLNRDWGRFSQPETATLAALIEREAKGRRLNVLLDFHSTHQSVVYAPPLGRSAELDAKMAAIRKALDATPAPPPWSHAHEPNRGTSKGWALDRFGVLGLTIELGDDAGEAEAQAIGRALAAEVAPSPR